MLAPVQPPDRTPRQRREEPLSILVVSLRGPTAEARAGGAQEYIRYVTREWVRAGHAVRILCGAERIGGRELPRHECLDGVDVHRVGRGRTPNSLAILAAVRGEARRADVVFENIMAYPLLLPPVLGGTPLVAMKHHMQGPLFFSSHGLVRGGGGYLLEAMIPVVYRGTDLIVPSEATAQAVSRWWLTRERRPVVAAPGIERADGAAPVQRSEHPSILYLGAVHLSRKRVDHLVQAFADCLETLPDAELWIAGSGPDESKIRELADGLPVRFFGYVDDAQKQRLLDSAWVFASPSLREGFGMTWLEANAAGAPVVGYELGLDTVTPDCSVMVPVGDVGALGQALRDILGDDDRRARMSAAARANARRFDWAETGRRILDVLAIEARS